MREELIDQINQILDESDTSSELAYVEALEKAVSLADQHEDIEIGLELRALICQHSVGMGRPDKMIVAWIWMISIIRKHNMTDTHYYQYTAACFVSMIRCSSRIATVSKAELDHMLEEMSHTYTELGWDQFHVESCRIHAGIMTGNFEMSAEALARRAGLERDPGESPAYAMAYIAFHHLFRRDLDGAYKHAGPLMEGRISDDIQPMEVHTHAMLQHALRGEWEIALKYQAQHMNAVRKMDCLVDCNGHHITMLALSKRYQTALKLFVEQFSNVLVNVLDNENLQFYMGMRTLFKSLSDDGVREVQLTISDQFPDYNSEHLYQTAALEKEAVTQMKRLAHALDRRNENDFYASWLIEHEKLITLSPPAHLIKLEMPDEIAS